MTNTDSLPLSQSEMSELFGRGESVIIQYRKAFEIQHSRANGCFYFSPIAGRASGLPYTKQGRFHAVTPEHFRKLQLA